MQMLHAIISQNLSEAWTNDQDSYTDINQTIILDPTTYKNY